MSIKASEISDLIKARIDKFQSATEARNVGTVVSVTDGIVRVTAWPMRVTAKCWNSPATPSAWR